MSKSLGALTEALKEKLSPQTPSDITVEGIDYIGNHHLRISSPGDLLGEGNGLVDTMIVFRHRDSEPGAVLASFRLRSVTPRRRFAVDLTEIFVIKRLRQQGVGKLLLELAEQTAISARFEVSIVFPTLGEKFLVDNGYTVHAKSPQGLYASKNL